MADIPVRMILEESSKAKLKNAISSLRGKKELFQHNGTNGKLSKQVHLKYSFLISYHKNI